MLTGDLVRARVVEGELRPAFVDPDKEAIVERAEALLDGFRQAADERWTRGRLDEEVDAIIGDSRDVKLLRGLAKVLADRATFEVDASGLDPVALREEVFLAATGRGPLALERGPLGRPVARDVLEDVARAKGTSVEALEGALYADLREEERITACDVPSPRWLLDRYNVALVQAVLLHATDVRVHLDDPTVPRMRQLFRHVKFHQLVHAASRDDKTLRLTLDGPASLFSQSTRYGMQLATFLPALLLQDGPWRLDATVLWTKARWKKTLRLSREDGLVSHLRDDGAWTTREQQWFAERWAAHESAWTMTDRTEPIDLGGRAVLLPDFGFTDGKRRAWLEIVGYWRKDWLERRVDLLRRYGPGNLVLAVSRKLLAGEHGLDDLPGEIVEFGEVVPPKAVVAALERVAT